MFWFAAFDAGNVENACSDSPLPHMSTESESLDSLILPCTMPDYYVSTLGVGNCMSTSNACNSIDLALSAISSSTENYGSVKIVGANFTNKEIAIPGDLNIAALYVESIGTNRASLSFSSTTTSTAFFTVCDFFFNDGS
jgi:hypothetical protein